MWDVLAAVGRDSGVCEGYHCFLSCAYMQMCWCPEPELL